jgi:hypothetical protein
MDALTLINEDSIISEKYITDAELHRACSPALTWLRECPRTWRELVEIRTAWAQWAYRCTGLIPPEIVEAWRVSAEPRRRIAVWESGPLDLSGADLSGAYLPHVDLSNSDLSGADLSGAVLAGAALVGADLVGADLAGAVLYGADLVGAVLYGADLVGAVLYGADLVGADLVGADLSGIVLVK